MIFLHVPYHAGGAKFVGVRQGVGTDHAVTLYNIGQPLQVLDCCLGNRRTGFSEVVDNNPVIVVPPDCSDAVVLEQANACISGFRPGGVADIAKVVNAPAT